MRLDRIGTPKKRTPNSPKMSQIEVTELHPYGPFGVSRTGNPRNIRRLYKTPLSCSFVDDPGFRVRHPLRSLLSGILAWLTGLQSRYAFHKPGEQGIRPTAGLPIQEIGYAEWS